MTTLDVIRDNENKTRSSCEEATPLAGFLSFYFIIAFYKQYNQYVYNVLIREIILLIFYLKSNSSRYDTTGKVERQWGIGVYNDEFAGTFREMSNTTETKKYKLL